MDVTITTIPHAFQRYDTIGDWQYDMDSDHLRISVSQFGNNLYEQAVAFHEYAEALGCIKAGITTKMVDDFDMSFTGEGEPGDDPRAPYHRQHVVATNIEEQLIVQMFSLSWGSYDEFFNKFIKENPYGNEAAAQ